jgi:hypothetical protein
VKNTDSSIQKTENKIYNIVTARRIVEELEMRSNSMHKDVCSTCTVCHVWLYHYISHPVPPAGKEKKTGKEKRENNGAYDD